MNTGTEFKVNGITYRLKPHVCNKTGCKCTRGESHGPYWYGYPDTGSVKYFGKQLPVHVMKHVELLKASAAKLKAIKSKITKRRDAAYHEYSLASDELRSVQALEAGEHVDSKMLVKLGLAQFNGHH